MTLTRDDTIDAVLAPTVWADWQRSPVTGDASARRYLRLHKDGQTAIVMDAPPATCTDTPAFIRIAALLREAGLQAPPVLLSDLAQGVLVLGDLGPKDVAAQLRDTPQAEQDIYSAIADLLRKVAKITPPEDLIRLTPEVGAQMIGVLGDSYCSTDIGPLQSAVATALQTHAGPPDTLSLRDFHAENLIWREGFAGSDRLGLLDFQDAFVAPAGYDLASLLRDARRDVSAQGYQAAMSRFLGGATDKEAMRRQIAVLGVQRNLRIMGIFANLATRAAKPRYLAFMPRLWRHITDDLAILGDPDLSRAVQDTLPEPTPSILQGLSR